MPSGRKLESLKDYQRALKNKFGIGQGSDYKPWLRVQDVKSIGHRSEIFGRKTQRIHHLLSSIESEFFYLSEFSDSVVDIREQFPILPLNYTQKVSHLLGIKHPAHPKTKEPIIITTDFVLTVDNKQGSSFHAISIKPDDKSHKLRTLEKIDLERVCWELLDVRFSYYTGNEYTRNQGKNIEWATSPFRETPTVFSEEQIDYVISILNLGQVLIEDVCSHLISKNIVPHNDALSLIRLLIAEKYIDVDLNYNIVESGILEIKSLSQTQRSLINGVI